jgi:hypothetical protein
LIRAFVIQAAADKNSNFLVIAAMRFMGAHSQLRCVVSGRVLVSAQPQLNVRFRGDCVAKVTAEKL